MATFHPKFILSKKPITDVKPWAIISMSGEITLLDGDGDDIYCSMNPIEAKELAERLLSLIKSYIDDLNVDIIITNYDKKIKG